MRMKIRNYCIRVLGLVLLLFCSYAVQAQECFSLHSPDGRLKAELLRDKSGEFGYNCSMGGKMLIDFSPIGYRMKSGGLYPASDWVVENKTQRQVRSVWKPVWGKREFVPDCFNELTLTLSPAKGYAKEKLVFVVRLYDDGLAFRYELPSGGEKKEIESELTCYNFAGNFTAWFYNGEQANLGPEKLSESNGPRRPVMLVKADEQHYLALHEADLRSGEPLLLSSEKGEYSFRVASVPANTELDNVSSWRVILAGSTPGKLVDSHLIELLNPDPLPGFDFSWVKPGVFVWDWRIDGAIADDFTYAMNYSSWVRMIDFASRQGFAGLVLDANWYGPEHESESDPLKGGKVSDVQRIIQYGKEKGVGVWLYLNDVGGKEFPIEETLKQYGEWGATGVKYGFMKGNPSEKNEWTRYITELCARNRLLVDYHDGPVHPYGQMRTWPNAITREYCHAQLDAHRIFVPSTFVTSVFVNMLAGPIDMNNGMFDLRQGPTTRVDESQPVPSTVVSEAARTLITFSGATILPDIPEFYQKYPELLSFISAQKLPWKESRTLDGKVGEYIVMMRQTESAYLVAAATNESARTLDISLSFLPKGEYDLLLVQDGKEAHYLNNRESYQAENREVKASDRIKVQLAPGGGACLLLRKRLPDCLALRNGLPFVSEKLRKGEPLTVAFLGGSITEAPGYRIQFEEWLKATYLSVKFHTINAGVGGTGSDLGVVRVDKQVLSQNPDLVFVEFAVNDAKTDSLQIVRSMEGIVRKIKKHSDKADICFLYTTNKAQQETIIAGNHWRSARIMEQVAAHYGIPSVSLDFAVASLLRQDKLVMHGLKGVNYENRIIFTEDGTHPGQDGHRVYTQALSKAFEQIMASGSGKPTGRILPLCSSNYETATMCAVKKEWLSANWQQPDTGFFLTNHFKQYFTNLAVTDKSGETITFRFTGTHVGLFDIMGPGSSRLKISIDGKPATTINRFDGYCTYYRTNYFWLPELSYGEHTVKIETDCTPFDKISMLNTPLTNEKRTNPDLKSYNVYIGKILVVGELQKN